MGNDRQWEMTASGKLQTIWNYRQWRMTYHWNDKQWGMTNNEKL